jgi:hypothetical protein
LLTVVVVNAEVERIGSKVSFCDCFRAEFYFNFITLSEEISWKMVSTETIRYVKYAISNVDS